MSNADDLPIALRRTRRSCSRLAAPNTQPKQTVQTSSSTPSKRGRPRKHVRFSDPGPLLDSVQHTGISSTGLTPMVKKTTLAACSTAKRRKSTPARAASFGNGLASDTPDSGDVTLRQVLDGRVQRRLRRDGASGEMNAAHSERRRKANEAKQELQRLKDEVASKDAEISRLQALQQQQHQDQDPDETIDTAVGDTERIFELEREVADLRQQLHDRSATTVENTHSFDWTLAAKDPFSYNDYSMMDVCDVEDHEFGDITMAELQCSTPSRRPASRMHSLQRATVEAPLPSPPATSPLAAMAPRTPSSMRFFSTPSSNVAVQATIPDPGKQRMEEELASLQLELSKITSTLKSYQAVASRVSDKMAAVDVTTTASTDPDASASPELALNTRLTDLLTTLSDRTAALNALSSSLSGLGFPGTDAAEIVLSIAADLRTARLELEYLTPGNIALPLTGCGAAIVDLLLVRLRALGKQTRDDEETIDQYHAQELSLRQLLAARVAVGDERAAEIATLKARLAERDSRVEELTVGLDRLKGAAKGYARDVEELEALVERVESQRVAALEECGTQLDEARRTREEAVKELEGRLATTLAEAGELRVRLANAEAEAVVVEKGWGAKIRGIHVAHGRQLALRDARVAELRGEVDRVNGALRTAHETVRGLRVDKRALEGRVEEVSENGRRAVEEMKVELERVVAKTPSRRSSRLSGGEGREDGSAVKPGGLFDSSLARRRSSSVSAEDGIAAEDSKGRKRRRYDSGLGFLDEEEVDI